MQCYCCAEKGTIKLPIDYDNCYYLCQSCYDAYKNALEVLGEAAK